MYGREYCATNIWKCFSSQRVHVDMINFLRKWHIITKSNSGDIHYGTRQRQWPQTSSTIAMNVTALQSFTTAAALKWQLSPYSIVSVGMGFSLSRIAIGPRCSSGSSMTFFYLQTQQLFRTVAVKNKHHLNFHKIEGNRTRPDSMVEVRC